MSRNGFEKILLASSHPIVCWGLSRFLSCNGFSNIEWVTREKDITRRTLGDSRDIIILDTSISGQAGIKAMSSISRKNNNIEFIVYSDISETKFARWCRSEGASGFVRKTDDPRKVVDAINSICDGYLYFPKSIDWDTNNAHTIPLEKIIASLTGREMGVLKMLARGLRNKDVARDLQMKQQSVSAYKSRILKKLGITGITELIDIARQNGL